MFLSKYSKKTPKTEFVDIYTVLNLYDVKSHAIGHAVKKLLCAGQRGNKDYVTDLEEAIVAINRELEIISESEPPSKK